MQETDYLVHHALENVWCHPMEDEQSSVLLARLTGTNGVKGEVDVFHDRFALPTPKDDYHVYMLGGNHPAQFTLIPTYSEWVNMKMWCAQNQLIVYFYTLSGKIFPLTDAWVLREEDDNLIFAIRNNPNIDDLNMNHLYVKFYHNEYWNRVTDLAPIDQILISGGVVDQVDYVETLGHNSRIKAGGKKKVFHNGKLTFHPRLDFPQGDVVELMFDNSQLRGHHWKVSELPSFQSKLDNTQKYLLHLPKLSDSNRYRDQVLYHDDMDIFLVKIPELKSDEEGGFFSSVITDSRYYYRHSQEAVRMVTHQDYSIPVDFVHQLIRKGDEEMDLSKWYVWATVRNNGTVRTLINEKNHIKELYRLADRHIVPAMVGTTATLKNWRAEELEASTYTYLMRAWQHELTKEKILDAYGYVSVARALANPGISITSDPTRPYFILPVGLINESTVFEYDVNGSLLGFYYQTGNVKYYPTNESCVYVEAFAGKGSDKPEYFINPPTTLDLNPQGNYRVYLADIRNEVIQNNWRDVTLDATRWVKGTEQGQLTYDRNHEAIVVIGDNHWLAYNTTLRALDGVYDFGIFKLDNMLPLPVPYGKIDLWMNGRAMIEGIDYLINYPTLTVLTKELFVEGVDQILTVRAMGFCDSQMNRTVPRERGFVSFGKLSVDNVYDLTDEAVSRISINGGVMNPMNITFDRQRGEAAVNVPDGRPYSIEEHYIPLKGFNGNDVYKAYEDDLVRFKQMSAYISKRFNTKAPTEKVVVRQRYRVYSPTMANILYAILSNKLDVTNLNLKDQNQLEKAVSQFKKWFPMDLAVQGWDHDFVLIEPFPGNNVVEVTYRELAFLEAINKKYLNNAVDLAPWFNIVQSRGN